jgi:predicted flap endonuclease-1-like 5' DNA nuclease
MSGTIVVFAVVFLVLFGVNLGVPDLPPGNIIIDLLGIPEITLAGVTLVNGIITGLFWGAIAAVIYSLIRRGSKPEPLSPMPAPPHLPTPVPTPMPREPSVKRQRPLVTKRKTQVPLDKDVEAIEGIGPTYGSRLRNAGVTTVKDLLRVGATRTGRRSLAYKVGVAPAELLKWVYRADFFRIRGIGTQYSSLLESAGVNTVPDLSMRNPANLYERLREINRKKKLVRRTPPAKTVEHWVKSAKNLKRIVEY